MRFGECLRLCKEKMNEKNIYLYNPAFDRAPGTMGTPGNMDKR